MLNLGNLNVKDLFLGSTKVSSAWLGTQKVWPVGSAQPYDYRVEWIETDGIASYIDTGVDVDYSPTTTTKVSMTFNFATMPSGSRGPCVCGARFGTSGVATAFVITIMDSSTNKRIITFHPSTVSTSPITPIDTDIHTIEMGYPNVLIDGIQVAATDTPQPFNPRFMIGCGGDPALWSFDNTLWHPANVRVYHCKIVKGGNVVFDAFPVVKDGKAGLYDRVSGKVLFNANTTGTITAGPQVPFDYEVEWIQRDVRYIWEQGGSSVTGGYNLSEYIPSGATVQNMPQYWLEGSCANTTQGPAHLVYYGANIFNFLNIWKTISNTVYSFGSGTVGQTSTDAYLDVFHNFAWKGTGGGAYDMYLDGSLFRSRTYTSTTAIKFFLLLYTTLTGERPDSEIKFRIKKFKFGNTIDMIPVVKDDKMGFYNRVDGKLFLEKQPCLSAGPAIK